MKKKVLAAVLAAAMTASLMGGCGTYTDSTPASTAASTEASAETAEAESTEETAEAAEEPAGEAGTRSVAPIAGSSVTIMYNPCVTLNVFQSQSQSDANDYYLLNSTLFRFYGDEIENDLCTSYEVSDDGLTYTFHLRDDDTYNTGEKVVAGDFVFFAQYAVNPDNGTAISSNFEVIKNGKACASGEMDPSELGIEAPDDTTLVITLEKEDSSFINQLAGGLMYPYRQDFVEKWGQELGSSPESILCSGAYEVTDFQVDTSLTLKKRDEWWNAQNEFPIENINIEKISTASTAASMFQNGQADVYPEVDANYLDMLADNCVSFPSGGQYYVWVREQGLTDEATKVLDNDNFRKALAYALDRTLIGPAINPNYTGSNRMVPANVASNNGSYVEEYPLSDELCPLAGDPEKAKEYLAAALEELGYSDVSELPEMTYLTYEDDTMKVLGETVIDQWKQILGITSIQFTQQQIGTAIGSLYAGDYDIFMISGECKTKPTDEMSLFTSDGEFSFHSVNWGPEFDEAYAEVGNYNFGTDEYYAATLKAEEALLGEYSMIPLYDINNTNAISSRLQNYVCTYHYGYQLNYVTLAE